MLFKNPLIPCSQNLLRNFIHVIDTDKIIAEYTRTICFSPVSGSGGIGTSRLDPGLGQAIGPAGFGVLL